MFDPVSLNPPFGSMIRRRDLQDFQNIFENSPELRRLYNVNQTLSADLRVRMREANIIRTRLLLVSSEYGNLFRQLIKEREEAKLKIVSCVKAKNKLYSTMETHCAICLKHHQYIDVCTLPCNHEYGTKCFEEWFSKGSKTCPECRNPTKEIKTYKQRAERKNKTNISKNVCSRNVLSPSPSDLPIPDVDILSPSPSPDVLPVPDI
jgi:hypothetical protein